MSNKEILKAMAVPEWCSEAAKRIANCGIKRGETQIKSAYFDLACEFYDSIVKAADDRDRRIELFSEYWKKRQHEAGFPETIKHSKEVGICDALFLLPGFEDVVEKSNFDALLACAVYAADWGKKTTSIASTRRA